MAWSGTATTTGAGFMAEDGSTLSVEHARWLEARGLDLEVAIRYGLFTARQSEHGRVLAIPYLRNGNIINHKYRLPGKVFRQDEGALHSLWNEDCLRDPSLSTYPLIITEGELDALAAIQAGYLRTVSVKDGAGSNLDFMAEEDIWGLIKDIPFVIIATDGDAPGTKIAEELARRIGRARCQRVKYPEGSKDLNDVLAKHGVDFVRIAIQEATPYPIKGLFRLSDYPDVPEPEVFSTGWRNLDPHIMLWEAEFIPITGIPSQGKSRFALELIGNIARTHGHRAAIASFEMRVAPYVRDVFRENYTGQVARALTIGQKIEADEWIEEQFCFIDQDPRHEDEDMTVEWLVERAEDAVVRYGIRWLLVDPWNQLQHKRNRGESTEEYQERAIRTLKRFARSFGVGVIVVAHPTKEVKLPNGELRKPGLYDIAGSAHWYNAADHGIIVSGDTTTTVREITVEKSRYQQYAGKPGSAWLELRAGRLAETLPPAKEEDE